MVLVGPVFWMYISETSSDIQFGPIATSHYANGALIAVVTEFLSKALKPEGLFALLGCITIFVAIIMQIFFKETRNLTDKEKKELYMRKEDKDDSNIMKDV